MGAKLRGPVVIILAQLELWVLLATGLGYASITPLVPVDVTEYGQQLLLSIGIKHFPNYAWK